ncbi:MAG: Omp28-related outer membrane protein [Ignavibacteriales bacterium]|nr:MAG: Omp28-related outer membrane protein [Ignavibacteriales bacterium]
MIKKFFPLFLLFTFFGCKTNPPVEPVVPINPTQSGKVYVQGNVTGALIYVDGLSTGVLTPDTITTSAGDRVIHLEKEGYIPQDNDVTVIANSTVVLSYDLKLQKTILLEDFANVSCIPCVASNKIIEALTRVTYGHSKLIAIKYPTNFPGPNDPFYLASKPNCDTRMTFYNILFAPTTIIDGRMRPISSDSIKIKDSINTRLQIPRQFEMTVTKSIVDSVYSTTVTIETLDGAGINFTNLVLHTVVTEQEIEFANPPGSNGETKFYDVMREMLPNFSGEVISNINQPGVFTFNRSFTLSGSKASWDKTKLHTVAFIQDRVTREVYQAVSTH